MNISFGDDNVLKIRQSYHGTGGKEGYRFKVYSDKGKKLGELGNIPINCGYGDVVSIDGELYKIVDVYDSKNQRDEKSEVIFYDLKPYVFKPQYDLGNLIK